MSQPNDMDNWVVLTDPAWQPATPDEVPPPEVMAGGWRLDDEGKPGPFRPSPLFVPSSPDTPTDPTDAVLRLIVRGQPLADELVPTVRDAILEIAVDDEDRPLVGESPDGVPTVAVATAPAHKERVGVPRWQEIEGTRLAEYVPDGVDILLNPDGPAAFRLRADALRTAD